MPLGLGYAARTTKSEVVIVGWSKAAGAVTIHEENESGPGSHDFPGFAAMKSGERTGFGSAE